HQMALWPYRLPEGACPPQVGLGVGANLELQVGEAGVHRCPGEGDDLRVRVAEPSRGRGVGGKPIADHLSLALFTCRRVSTELIDSLVRCERVVDVSKVDAGDQVLW